MYSFAGSEVEQVATGKMRDEPTQDFDEMTRNE